eukprot:gene17759-21155_t
MAIPGFLESLVDVSLELPKVSELSVYQHCAENLYVACRGLRALKLTGCHDLTPAQLSTLISVEWPVTTSLTTLDHLHAGLHRIDLSFTGPKPTALIQTLRTLRVHGPAAGEVVLRKWQGAQLESLCVQCKQLEELDLSHLERLTHLDLVEMDRLQWLYLPTF